MYLQNAANCDASAACNTQHDTPLQQGDVDLSDEELLLADTSNDSDDVQPASSQAPESEKGQTLSYRMETLGVSGTEFCTSSASVGESFQESESVGASFQESASVGKPFQELTVPVWSGSNEARGSLDAIEPECESVSRNDSTPRSELKDADAKVDSETETDIDADTEDSDWDIAGEAPSKKQSSGSGFANEDEEDDDEFPSFDGPPRTAHEILVTSFYGCCKRCQIY